MYGLKTADNQGLYRVIDSALPEGVSYDDVWPVNDVIPSGYYRGGWNLVSGTVEPILIEIPPYVEPEPEIPYSVGPFQIRAALLALGYADSEVNLDTLIENAIDVAVTDPTQNIFAKLAWKRASEFRRDSAFIEVARLALGKSPEDIDLLFTTAATF